jgi:hypothetical protein
MTTIQSSSQISPANERVYHQSYLLGDWKGTWTNSSQPVEFKVVNIRGDKAQVEYTHNGHTERGLGDVNGGTITFGNVTIVTRNGTKAGTGIFRRHCEIVGNSRQADPGCRSKQSGRQLERLFTRQRPERKLSGPVRQWKRCAGKIYREWSHPPRHRHRVQKYRDVRQGADFIRRWQERKRRISGRPSDLLCARDKISAAEYFVFGEQAGVTGIAVVSPSRPAKRQIRVGETASEKKSRLHAFLLLRIFARIGAGAFFFDLI